MQFLIIGKFGNNNKDGKHNTNHCGLDFKGKWYGLAVLYN